ncbi:MAG: WG repeat-containing protein [Ignavibacteria bacterium]|nr:WG repeat-containing protein [Ignavibacteria bacterium]
MKYIIQIAIVVLVMRGLVYGQDNSPLLIYEHGKYGYVNNKGEVVIEPQYGWACDFSGGRAVVRLEFKDIQSTYGVINEKGELVFKIEKGYPDLYYSDGLLKVEESLFEHPVYYDENGNIAIDKNIYFGIEFCGGYASVQFSKKGKFGFIDTKGNLVIDTMFTILSRFYNGYAFVHKDHKEYLLDSTGRLVEIKYFNAIDSSISKSKNITGHGEIQNGLMSFKFNETWGYINMKGELVINPIFNEAGDFSEGLAAVRYNGKYGYIDTSGKFVIDPIFNNAEEFSEGLAFVLKSSSEFRMAGPHTNAVINMKGEVIIDVDSVLGVKKYKDENNDEVYIINMFYGASKFKNGIAKFYEGYHFSGRIRYINKDGKLIW